MKKLLSALLIGTCIFAINDVKASEIYYTNNKNVEMTQEEYNILIERGVGEEWIANISQHHFDFFTSPNFKIESQSTIYLKSEIRYNDNIIIEEKNSIVTEEEYENSNEKNLRSGMYETTYKKIELVAQQNGSTWALNMKNTWKQIPKVKSYDVIATTWLNANNQYKVYGYSGYQSCKDATGNTLFTSYSSGGSNSVVENDGIGISMNIYDDAVSDLVNVLYIEGSFASSGGALIVNSTYQHATQNVSLAQSKSYTFPGTVGGVLNFNSATIKNMYDQMQGVSITIYP